MNNLVNLDVLVVYSTDLATSASVKDLQTTHPFSLDSKQANYNLSYAHFLAMCRMKGISAGFTTSSDIVGAGECRNFWSFRNNHWIKIDKGARSQHIFDKISPTSSIRLAERELLLSDATVIPFNDTQLFTVFCDKLLTYKKFSEYAIPTVCVTSSRPSDIKVALKKLKKLTAAHPHVTDFSNQIVIKDRFGAGGNHVYKIEQSPELQVSLIMKKHPSITFVLQPFVIFNQGYTYRKIQRSTDIRLIYFRGKLLQSYIRVAKGNDFRCNEHQGGQLVYVTKKDIPKDVYGIAEKMVKKINKPRALYALDFVISNKGYVHFLEGNVGPGIDWDVTKKINEKMSKDLIQNIVNEFATRIHRESAVTLSYYKPH